MRRARGRSRLKPLFVVLMAGGLGVPWPASADTEAAVRPAIVDRALRAYGEQTRGVIGYRAKLTSSGHAMRRDTHSTVFVAMVFTDDVPVMEEVLQVHSDNDAPPAALQKLQESLDRKVAAPDASPLHEADSADYRYVLTPCDDCERGVVRVAFTSIVRNARHGDGALWIDDRTAHVLKVTAKPARLVPPMTAAETTTSYGPLPGGSWGRHRAISRTTVHVLFVDASSETVEEPQGYQRFATVEQARQSLTAAP